MVRGRVTDRPYRGHVQAPSVELNPAQQQVLAALSATLDERPSFPAELAGQVRDELETRLAPLVERIADATLSVNKHALSSAHGCEGHYVASALEPFMWSAATARGTVAHKAIELAIHWRGDAAPLELIDEAMARLSQSELGLGEWLADCGPGERAELRGEANDRLTKYLECFPPLVAKWWPVPESATKAELCGGRIVLRGKVDLTIGRAAGLTAGKVLIDLKTGGFVPAHRDDLRFYALLELLRLGVPPRRVATYYLDSATLHAEDITLDLLEVAVERTVRGIEAIVELRYDSREPVLRPGPPCRWCPVLETCDVGREHLAQVDDVG